MKTRTVLRRRHAAAPVTVRSAGWLSAGLLLTTAALGPAAHVVAAASVAPTPVDSGNPTCADLAPSGETWQQLKLGAGQLKDGTYTDGRITVTISHYVDSSGSTPGAFDWAADQGVDAVFVKAGSSKHNLYVYSPEATSDAGLGPQAGRGNGISHILFCYEGVDAAQPAASTDPTDPPSGGPTDPPSGGPTDPPSADPSDAASAAPSEEPSSDPSQAVDPSNDPGAQESDAPSADPSDAPTAAPTDDPGAQPSDPPSDDPGAQPSDEPSADPSANPSTDPSQGIDPSDDPGIQPTDDPTATQTDPPAGAVDGDQSAASSDPASSPTGAVLGATSGPVVTAPPTDTLRASPRSESAIESWRIIAAGLGLLIVGLLLVPARPASGRARR